MPIRSLIPLAAGLACLAATPAQADDYFSVSVHGTMTYQRHDVFPLDGGTEVRQDDVTAPFDTEIGSVVFRDRYLLSDAGGETTFSDVTGRESDSSAYEHSQCDATRATDNVGGSIFMSEVADLTGQTAIELRTIGAISVFYDGACQNTTGHVHALSATDSEPGHSPFDVYLKVRPAEIASGRFEKAFDEVTTPRTKCPAEILPYTKTCSVSLKGTAVFTAIQLPDVVPYPETDVDLADDPAPSPTPAPTVTPAPTATPVPRGGRPCAPQAAAHRSGRRLRVRVACGPGSVTVAAGKKVVARRAFARAGTITVRVPKRPLRVTVRAGGRTVQIRA